MLGLCLWRFLFLGRFSWRTVAYAVALATAVALVATGCSGQQHPAQTASKPGSVSVDPGHSASLRLPGGLEVNVPAHAVTRAGTLSASVTSAAVAAPSGMELAGPVYDLHLAGTTLHGLVTLSVPVPRQRQQGVSAGPNAALLVYFDSRTGRWQPVNASYNPGTRTLTATSSHLSKWSVILPDPGQIRAAAVSTLKGFLGIADPAQPLCPKNSQLAALGVKVTADPGDLVKWCPDDIGTGAVIRVASNRSYAMEADYPADWSMSRVGSLDPVTEQILKYLPALSLSVSGPNVRTVIIPGGQQVDLRPPTGASGTVLMGPTAEGILVDAMLYGAGTLAMTFGEIPGAPKPDPAKTAQAVALAFEDGVCLNKFKAVAQNPDVSTPQAAGGIFRSFTDVAVGCLADTWAAAYHISGSEAAIAVSILLWLADGIKLIWVDLHSLIDSAMYWQGYHIYIRSTSPVQGSPSSSPTAPTSAPACPNATPPVPAVIIGPNCTKPTVLYFSGDQTVSIQGITWTSWNTSGATGRGTWYLVDCNPNCAQGPVTNYPATLTLSNVQNGLFTVLTTTRNSQTNIWNYPDNWPQHT
jgi:hypothetical protein